MPDTARFSIIHPLYMAFFSKALYRDVGRSWKGYGLVYLFSVVGLCMIPFALLAQSAVSDYLNKEAPRIIRQMPEITVSNGKLSIDRPEPYFVRDEQTGEPFIIFDSGDKAGPAQRAKVPILVLKSEIVVRGERGKIKRLDLSDVKEFHADRRLLYEWLDAFGDSFAAVFYPLAVLISFAFRVVEALVFAAAGSIFTRSQNTRLAYPDLVRLSAVALTPPMVVGACFNLAGATIPFWWLAGIPISLAYLYYGMSASSERSRGI
jgi:hypothetical protein